MITNHARMQPRVNRNGDATTARRDEVEPWLNWETQFSELYRTYFSRVFAFVYSRVRDATQAEDICSETFEQAYAKAHTLRDRAAFSSWLFAIARNSVNSHFRKQKRRFAAIGEMSESFDNSSSIGNAEDQVVERDLIARLRHHLRSLPPREQEILSLRFDAELSCAEIGKVLHMSQVNVRVAVFRAISRLRQRMSEEETNEKSGTHSAGTRC